MLKRNGIRFKLLFGIVRQLVGLARRRRTLHGAEAAVRARWGQVCSIGGGGLLKSRGGVVAAQRQAASSRRGTVGLGIAKVVRWR